MIESARLYLAESRHISRNYGIALTQARNSGRLFALTLARALPSTTNPAMMEWSVIFSIPLKQWSSSRLCSFNLLNKCSALWRWSYINFHRAEALGTGQNRL